MNLSKKNPHLHDYVHNLYVTNVTNYTLIFPIKNNNKKK